MSTITELLSRLGASVNTLDEILLGDENVTVTLNGVTKPSISKAIHTRFTEYRTVSTSAPSGVPRDGEEWIVVDGDLPPPQEEPVLIHGNLELNENPLDFGAVTTYNPVTKTLTVTNIGDEPVTGIDFSIESDPGSSFILAALTLNGEYIGDPGPHTLNPGETFKQDLMAFPEFNATPEIIGEKTGTLTIIADGHDDIEVPLKSLTSHGFIHVTKDDVELGGSTPGSPYLDNLETNPSQTILVSYVVSNSGNYPIIVDFGLGAYNGSIDEIPGFTNYNWTSPTTGMIIYPGEEYVLGVYVSPESAEENGVLWVMNTGYMGLGRPGFQAMLNY